MTYYEELGVRQDAPVEEIRQAYKTLARLLHPDGHVEPDLKPMAERQMQRLVEIVSVLSDPGKRSHYDEMLLLGNRLPATCGKRPVPLPRRDSNNRAAEFALRHWFWILNGIFVVALGTWTFLQSNPAVPDHPGLQGAAWQRDPIPEYRGHQVVQKPNTPQRRVISVLSEASPTIPSDGARLVARAPVVTPPEPPSAPELEDIPAGVSPPEPLTGAAVDRMASPGEGRPDDQDRPPSPKVSSFAGRWLYTPQLADSAERGMYSAIYVELSLIEHAGELTGDYRARYNVPDRAVSPEVTFKIRGSPGAATSGEFAWLSGDNAKGQVEMTLRGPNVLYVSWWTTEFGRRATLGSGTAVLIRLQVP